MAVKRSGRIYSATWAQFRCDAEHLAGKGVNLFDCQWRYGYEADVIVKVTTSDVPYTQMADLGANLPLVWQNSRKLIAPIRLKRATCDNNETLKSCKGESYAQQSG